MTLKSHATALAADTATVSSRGGDYRTGTAARLAGLPVETLRVWERRYGISDTARSARGQRLYSDVQVRRLALIKQLVDQGHGVGTLARLSDEQLRALAPVASARQPSNGAAAAPVKVALVGDALVRRLPAGGRELFALDIVAACAGLADSERLHLAGAQVLVIEVAELSDDVIAPIAALREATGAAAVVLYRFASSATLARLRAQGCLVAQSPADLAQLVLLCEAARAPIGAPGPHGTHGSQGSRGTSPVAPVPVLPPRYDDTTLASLSTMGGSLACECPRHLADLLTMLASFERYSIECASRSPADQALHLDLGVSAGQARMLLEGALDRLARTEGLQLASRV